MGVTQERRSTGALKVNRRYPNIIRVNGRWVNRIKRNNGLVWDHGTVEVVDIRAVTNESGYVVAFEPTIRLSSDLVFQKSLNYMVDLKLNIVHHDNSSYTITHDGRHRGRYKLEWMKPDISTYDASTKTINIKPYNQRSTRVPAEQLPTPGSKLVEAMFLRATSKTRPTMTMGLINTYSGLRININKPVVTEWRKEKVDSIMTASGMGNDSDRETGGNYSWYTYCDEYYEFKYIDGVKTSEKRNRTLENCKTRRW